MCGTLCKASEPPANLYITAPAWLCCAGVGFLGEYTAVYEFFMKFKYFCLIEIFSPFFKISTKLNKLFNEIYKNEWVTEFHVFIFPFVL